MLNNSKIPESIKTSICEVMMRPVEFNARQGDTIFAALKLDGQSTDIIGANCLTDVAFYTAYFHLFPDGVDDNIAVIKALVADPSDLPCEISDDEDIYVLCKSEELIQFGYVEEAVDYIELNFKFDEKASLDDFAVLIGREVTPNIRQAWLTKVSTYVSQTHKRLAVIHNVRRNRMSQQEYFCVVNTDNQVIMKISDKDRMHALKLPHRSVHVMLEAFDRRFVIQKKASGTENAGKWSSAVSGHVRFGESYQQAAMRESIEEISLELCREDLKFISTVPACEQTGNEFVGLFTYLIDREEEDKINIYNTNEVDELLICSLETLIDDIQANSDEYSPAFIHLFNIFLVLEQENIGHRHEEV